MITDLRGVRIKLLSPTAKAPQYMTAGAAGADVFADFGGFVVANACVHFGSSWGGGSFGSAHMFSVTLSPGTVRIPLGIALEIPSGWVGVLKGRSGLASRGNDAHVAALDSDYRGEACMLLHVGSRGAVINHGDRVGQILFMPAPQFELEVVDELSETTRGAGGFGHTGSR